MDHVLGAIEPSKVTTGLLKEFGVRHNEVELFNGTISSDNLVDEIQWQSLYSSLYSMRVGATTTMTDPATMFSNLAGQQAASPDILLLAVQYYQYQQYKANAYTNGDVTVSNDRIYDVAGRNPYETQTAFAVTPLKNEVSGYTFSFMLPGSMIYTSTSLTLSYVQADFDDGQGYQTIAFDNTVDVTYNTGGEKELKVKFLYNGGTTLYSHSKIYVTYIPPTPGSRFNGSILFRNKEYITGDQYLGVSDTGEVTIELASGHSQLTKPLIVVEGFDPFNRIDYRDLINDDDNGGLNRVIDESTGRTLNQAIEEDHYDLVFVNYRNSMDYIQRNAYMVEEVIEWVNGLKVGSEKNVVLGMSMGGLVARYALRHMEQTGRTHDTKLYISHDVPHQGANVPLAFQALVRHLAGESIRWPILFGLGSFDISVTALAPELNDGLAILQSPAAQQMLIYQLSGIGGSISNTTNSMRQSFVSEYTGMGYPTQGGIRCIAISDGSECGTPLGFQPYSVLANIDYTYDLNYFVGLLARGFSFTPLKMITSLVSFNTDIKVQFTMRALPNQQSQQIYRGRIYIKKKVLGFINIEEPLINEKTLNSTASMLPLDNAGGGVYDIAQLVSLPPEISQYILEPRFNFIPTFSSLDIGSGLQTIILSDVSCAYSVVSPPASPKTIPFQNFYTNPAVSEDHIQFTLNNGNWLVAELARNPVLSSCNHLCTGTSIFPVISGPSLVCSSGATFTLSNVPLGSTVYWDKSSNITLPADRTTNPIVATANGNGTGWVQATIISTACGSVTLPRYTVWAGTPIVNYIMDQNSNQIGVMFCPNVNYGFWPKNDILCTPTSYYWSISPTSGVNGFCNTCLNNWLSFSNTSVYYLSVNETNACGTGSPFTSYIVVTPCGYYRFSLSPNPASDNVKLTKTFVQDTTALAKAALSALSESNNSDAIVYTVKIYNSTGTLFYSTKKSGDEFTLPVNYLKDGTYIIEVTDGKQSYRQPLIIKH
jgi:hypothetical protein